MKTEVLCLRVKCCVEGAWRIEGMVSEYLGGGGAEVGVKKEDHMDLKINKIRNFPPSARFSDRIYYVTLLHLENMHIRSSCYLNRSP
jgi:hypothetical protein